MIISGSFLKIYDDNRKIKKLDEVVDMIHFDVMDGKFTENKTSSDISISFSKPIDVHLMVLDPIKYVDEMCKYKPKFITFHYEIGNTLEYINYIKSKNIKVGLAISIETEVKEIYDYLSLVDLVLVMSVPIGKGGQTFNDISDKTFELIKYRKDNNLNYLIEVDGGINEKIITKVKNVDIVVSGSYITDSPNYGQRVSNLKKIISGFTLVELLGVIVLLSILGVIAVSTIDKNIKQGRVKTCKTQEKNIVEGAKTYIIDNPNYTGNLTIGTLKSLGYINEDLINPMTDNPYNDSSYVSVSYSSNKYTYVVTYVGENGCE